MSPEVIHTIAVSIGAAVGGAVGSIGAVRMLMRRIAKEESQRTVVQMVRPEAMTPPHGTRAYR